MGGVGPIPLTEIEAYLKLYNIVDLDEREYFIKMIKALDSEYISLMNERTKASK